jgi:D-cysteine desulfhydrase
MPITYPPRTVLAHLPTPLHECRHVSDLLRPGQRLWVKRDDETGCVTTGNKLRKLELYIAQAQGQGADTLITAGSALSNHCRTTALAARQAGMEVALLLHGPERPRLDGNFLLMVLAGAIIRTDPGSSVPAEAQLEDMAERLRERGRRPYIIPPAGSGELGATSYVKAAEELKAQLDEAGVKPGGVTICYGSGSTYSGLLLGARLHRIDCPVVGLSISGVADGCRSRARDLVDRTTAFLGVDPCVPDGDIQVLDDYRGEGYGKAPEDLYAFIHDMAKRTGLILDPVYTGKALWGTIEEMRSGCLQEAQDVVFVHTGGVFGIYQKKEGFKLEWETV